VIESVLRRKLRSARARRSLSSWCAGVGHATTRSAEFISAGHPVSSAPDSIVEGDSIVVTFVARRAWLATVHITPNMSPHDGYSTTIEEQVYAR
jgi:hypothetical protein